MYTLGLIFSLSILAFAGYVGWTVYSDYRTEVGTRWQRLLATAQHSATLLWSKFCIVIAAVTAQIDNVADLLGAPEAKDFINAYVGNPKIIAALMLVMATVTIVARKRTL